MASVAQTKQNLAFVQKLLVGFTVFISDRFIQHANGPNVSQFIVTHFIDLGKPTFAKFA